MTNFHPTQGSYMSCSYSDIATQYFEIEALEYTAAGICCKDFGIMILLSVQIVLINLMYF